MEFDRLIGALHGLPDVATTKAVTIRVLTPLIGASSTWIVQTYRQKEIGDTIFIQCVEGSGGTISLVIPPAVADAIARQHDQLVSKSRSRASRESARARMERGEKPAFLTGKKGRK